MLYTGGQYGGAILTATRAKAGIFKFLPLSLENAATPNWDTACMKRSLDVARRLTAPGLDRDPESFAPPGLDRELNESSSTKGTASDLGISELQNSVTASGRTIPVEDARSVNRHSQTRSGGAGERFSPAESSSRLYLTLKQQQQQLSAICMQEGHNVPNAKAVCTMCRVRNALNPC